MGNDEPFFRQNGHRMTTSLSVEFGKLANTLGCSSLPSATKLRKAAQTLAPVETQREREAMAGLLHHSVTTAATHYRLVGQHSASVSWLYI